MITADFLDNLNLFSPGEVFHVGSLSPADKRNNSYEGSGLSVSMHPEDWEQIAGLGGHPHWSLKPGPHTSPLAGAFLLATSLSDTQVRTISDWAVSQDLLVPQQRWRLDYCGNDDNGEDIASHIIFKTLTEANAEANAMSEDSEPSVAAITMNVATDKMLARCAVTVNDLMASDIALTMFAEDHGLDGVWWDDHLDPANLSAPRGVICLSKLDSWSKEMVREACKAPTPRM